MNRAKALSHTIWLLCCLLIAACSPGANDQTRRPDNLLPADQMVDILTEVHIAESRVSKLGLTAADSSALIYRHLEQKIYRKLKVDTAAYRQSYNYYASDPTQLEAIYKEVVKKLQQRLEPPKKTDAPKKPARA